MRHGKKYRKSSETIEDKKLYSLEEAVTLVKKGAFAKFDEAVEVHFNLAIDPKKGEEQARGSVTLPHGTGKTKVVAVITSTKAKEAKEAGADIVEGEEMIEKIKNGKAKSFDVLVATPEMMPKLAQVAKILGPKGLMPSPKTETVTLKIAEAVGTIKKGRINFKNDVQGNIHQVIGKVSFTEDQLKENLKAFLEVVQKSKQATVKGKLIHSATLCTTMGPGVKISL